MFDERYIELMNGEIDGVNSPEESLELERFLDEDPEARRYYEDLCQVAGAFNAARKEEIEPPPELRESILSSIFEREERKGFLAGWAASWRPRFSKKYTYAFGAGIIVGICLFALISRIAPSGAPEDLERLYGTITTERESSEGLVAEPFDFDVSGISGSTNVRYMENRIFVKLSLSAESEIEVMLQFDEAVSFEGMSVSGRGHHQSEFRENGARLTHIGSREYFLVFKDDRRSKPRINFRVLADESLIFEKAILPGRI